MSRATASWAMAGALLLFSASTRATPPEGVPQTLRHGPFVDVGMGAFATAGGRDLSGAAGLSSPQAYLELGLGLDLGSRFALGLGFGLGAAAEACYAEVDTAGRCVQHTGNGQTVVAAHFTLTMLLLQVAYRQPLGERLSLQPRLSVGYGLLDPEPVIDEAGRAVRGGLLAGLGLGVEYATHMDHLSVGAELSSRLVVGPNVVALAVVPRLKYVF